MNVNHVVRLYTLLLLQAEPRHGYEIIKEIEAITGEKPTTSHVYPFLQDLASNGLVETAEEDDRGKKVYRLTEEGESFVQEKMDSFGTILQSAIEGSLEECSHCDCTIYDGGYSRDGKTYCCKHCADAAN